MSENKTGNETEVKCPNCKQIFHIKTPEQKAKSHKLWLALFLFLFTMLFIGIFLVTYDSTKSILQSTGIALMIISILFTIAFIIYVSDYDSKRTNGW